jgi:hypothetical protein
VAREFHIDCNTCVSLWTQLGKSSDRLLFARHALTTALGSGEPRSLEDSAGEIEGATREWSQVESAVLIHWWEHRGGETSIRPVA